MIARKTAVKLMGLVVCLALIVGGMAGVLAQAPATVGMMIDPTPTAVQVGQSFTVNLVVTIDGSQEVDTAEAHLDFEPAMLEVPEVAPGVFAITPGPTLANVNLLQVDNGAGTIDYAAGANFTASRANTTFVLFSIEFLAKQTSAGTPLRFVDQFPLRDTDAWFEGWPVIDPAAVFDGNVVITEGTPIYGLTREVKCDILPGTTVTLYQGLTEVDGDVSDASGNYEVRAPGPGDYTLVASKAGFRDETALVTVAGLDPVELDFAGEYGLIPNAPDMWYALDCVDLWQYPPNAECELDMWTALDAVDAWQYPVSE